jgi:hypothetical protein
MTALAQAQDPANNAVIELQTPIAIATRLMELQMKGEFIEAYVAGLPPHMLPRVQEALLTAMRMQVQSFKTVADACVKEAGAVMKERGARSIPDPDFEIALEEEFSAYTRNVDAAIEAALLLPEKEAIKVYKMIPAWTETIYHPAEHVVGAPVSINALRKKYAGSEVDTLLGKALHRTKVGEKVIMRRRTGPVANESANAGLPICAHANTERVDENTIVCTDPRCGLAIEAPESAGFPD